MAHRLLAAIIQWEAVPREALDTSAATELIDNLNQRHTLAQHAGRASVALHTLIYFRAKATEEELAAIAKSVTDNKASVIDLLLKSVKTVSA
jgi:exosome complex exonuclease DIS3/RRP44